MPLYEYQCQECGHRLEVMRRFSDPPLTECPQCGGPLEKLVSAPAFQFKGSGWYVTDYAGKSGGKEGGESKSGDAKAEGSKSSDAKSGDSSSSKSSGSDSKSTGDAKSSSSKSSS